MNFHKLYNDFVSAIVRNNQGNSNYTQREEKKKRIVSLNRDVYTRIYMYIMMKLL